MITTQQVRLTLELVEPQTTFSTSSIPLLTAPANKELAAWDRAEHEVALERVIPFFGDPRVLRWSFWCETCHVSQLALLSRPAAS